MTKNIIVTDEFGGKISSTYPKRARGLIKTGRAELVNEREIRLIGSCPPYILEDINEMSDNIFLYNENTNNNGRTSETIAFVNKLEAELESVSDAVSEDNTKTDVKTETKTEEQKQAKKHKLYFNSREWRFNPDCKSNVGTRTMITDMNGEIKEAWCIGSWHKELTEIQTENLALPKNTEFTFTFWLNGGENDRFSEICQLQVLFDDDYENRYTYKLNRGTIRPVKCFKGWVLFEVPFKTENNTYTRLRFSVEDAHTAILPALDKEAYNLLPNEKPNPKIPQRHNIVFEDGYPRDSAWSYVVFGDKLTQKAKTAFTNFGETASEYAEKTSKFAEEAAEKAGKIAGETASKAGKLAEEAASIAKKALEFAGEKVKDLKHTAVNSEFARTHFYSDIDFDDAESAEETDENTENPESTENSESGDKHKDIKEAVKSELRVEIEVLKELQGEISKKIDSLLK